MRRSNTYDSLNELRSVGAERKRTPADSANRKVFPIDPQQLTLALQRHLRTNAENESAISIVIECLTADSVDLDNIKVMEVRGQLYELLGDFKQRHFENELASNQIVQLYFDGHILEDDSQSLQECGLFDYCVVRCVIQDGSINEVSTEVSTGLSTEVSTEVSTEISANDNPADVKADDNDVGLYLEWKKTIKSALIKSFLLSFTVWISWIFGLSYVDTVMNADVDIYVFLEKMFIFVVLIFFTDGLLALGNRVFDIDLE